MLLLKIVTLHISVTINSMPLGNEYQYYQGAYVERRYHTQGNRERRYVDLKSLFQAGNSLYNS